MPPRSLLHSESCPSHQTHLGTAPMTRTPLQAAAALILRTFFRNVHTAWSKLLLVDKDDPDLGSWLDGRWNSPAEFTAFCMVCAANAESPKQVDMSPWAKGEITTRAKMQLCHARRHQSSKSHRQAIARLLGQEVNPDANETLMNMLSEVWGGTLLLAHRFAPCPWGSDHHHVSAYVLSNALARLVLSTTGMCCTMPPPLSCTRTPVRAFFK